MTTCATCRHWTLKNRLDADARAMARLHLVNCTHGKAWEFLPPTATCPRHEPASAETLEGRREWLSRFRSEPAEGRTTASTGP